jgi:hypothetical protein
MGSKFEICSIFKPNAPLAKLVEDVRKRGKELTNQDHTVIVGGVRGWEQPGYKSVLFYR